MKVLEVQSTAPSYPEYANSLPSGTVLRGRKYKHLYQVNGDGDIVRLSDGKVIADRQKTSEYEVLPAGTKVTFEV